MKTKQIIKNIIISIIMGIVLGSITEFALIFDISWLIRITQSITFWGVIICICAFISENYALALINPSLVLTLMNMAYYVIRLIKSGYTDIEAWKLFTLTGIAGSMYIGTIISIIKTFYHKQNNILIKHNFIFSIDLGIIVGFVISIIIKFWGDRIRKK